LAQIPENQSYPRLPFPQKAGWLKAQAGAKFGTLMNHIKRIIFPMLLFPFVSGWLDSAAAADSWSQIVGNGFGDANNAGVGWIQSFNGCLYVALDRTDGSAGGAMIYRSSDLTNWTRVVGPGTGTVLGDTVTEIIRMLVSGTNDIYFGTHDSSPNPARVYHSIDGANWTHITTTANGYAPAGNSSIGGLAVQGTNLFVATVNAGGAQIWRAQRDGTGFTNMANFKTGLNLPTGINTNINFVSYLYAATNGMVYASTSHLSNGVPTAPQNGFLYQTADGGRTWTTNRGVGNGFGDTNNWHIACMAEFSGGLYASVNNDAKGGQLWRTTDGANWVQVLTNGINDARNIELHHLGVDSGFLWVATLPMPGFADEVWRSSDGTNFTQSNLAGFGDPNNSSRFPSVGGLGSNELFGSENDVTGAQLWRLGPIVTNPVLQASVATNSFCMTWPAMALGFGLERTVQLAPPVWVQATNSIFSTNATNCVLMPATNASQFYRLWRP
jgi:hypothetical protein